MNYGRIKYYDIANGTGVRTSLFVSGCYRKCPGCFSPETWSFAYQSRRNIVDDRMVRQVLESEA